MAHRRRFGGRQRVLARPAAFPLERILRRRRRRCRRRRRRFRFYDRQRVVFRRFRRLAVFLMTALVVSHRRRRRRRSRRRFGAFDRVVAVVVDGGDVAGRRRRRSGQTLGQRFEHSLIAAVEFGGLLLVLPVHFDHGDDALARTRMADQLRSQQARAALDLLADPLTVGRHVGGRAGDGNGAAVRRLLVLGFERLPLGAARQRRTRLALQLFQHTARLVARLDEERQHFLQHQLDGARSDAARQRGDAQLAEKRTRAAAIVEVDLGTPIRHGDRRRRRRGRFRRRFVQLWRLVATLVRNAGRTAQRIAIRLAPADRKQVETATGRQEFGRTARPRSLQTDSEQRALDGHDPSGADLIRVPRIDRFQHHRRRETELVGR